MDAWICGYKDGWMDGCVDVLMYGLGDKRTDGWLC
jgi:hypothetical protein